MTILIRYAAVADVDACQQIAREFRLELPFVMRVQMQKSIAQREMFVAEVGGNVVGFARFHARRDGLHTLYDLAVTKAAQQQGVGAWLVQAIPTPIRVRTTVDNEAANRFYRRLGFRYIATEPSKKRAINLYELDTLLAYVRGGEPDAVTVARWAGCAYGVRNDYKAYAQSFMLDIHWTDYDWNEYMQIVATQHPVQAMVPDYESPLQKARLYEQIADLRAAGVLRVMCCPKFAGAVADIPADCVLAISVPTEYAGFLPSESLAGRKLHLLGGHPDQWIYVKRYRYPRAHILSIDGNIAGLKAQTQQYWDCGWREVEAGRKEDRRHLATVSLRNARRELFDGALPKLVYSRRVLRCAILDYEPQPTYAQAALFA